MSSPKNRTTLVCHVPTALALVIGLLTPAHAQSEARSPAADFTQVVFTGLSWKGHKYLHYSAFIPADELEERIEAGESFDYTISAQPVFDGLVAVNKAVSIPTTARSRRQAYYGPSTLRLYAEPPKADVVEDEEGNIRIITRSDPVAAVQIPGGSREYVILLFPDDTKPDALRAVPVPDDADALPEGGYRFINLSDLRLVGGAESARFTLQPFKSTLMNPEIAEERTFPVRIFNPKRSREKPVYSSRWYHRPTQRILVFIRPSYFVDDAIEIKAIEERPGQREQEPD